MQVGGVYKKMIAKLGFVLLFVIFGVLTLMMGVFATDDARGRLPGIEQIVQGGDASTTARQMRPSPQGAAANQSRLPEATSSAKAVAQDKLPIPAGAPGKVRYTVQLGMFADQAAADALVAQIEAMHLPGIKANTVAVRDRAGRSWWIAAAGDQDAPEALESARFWLSEKLSLSAARVIQLPVTGN
jgi:hypothetical protein